MTATVTESTFHQFFDDAAIFPPGLAPLPRAVEEFIRYSQDPITRVFLGPLVLPLDKITEAMSLADGTPLAISVVVTADRIPEVGELFDGGSGVTVEAVEVKAGDDVAGGIESAAEFKAAHPRTAVFVEMAASDVSDASVTELKQLGLALKFRTGGIEKNLFPSPEKLIEVLDLAVRAGLPFKLTAGLHRAMRYTDTETGFDHFGFLNIAAATAVLRASGNRREALEHLNTDDTEVVTTAVAREPDWRESFLSFGTCSLVEPTETLGQLGQLSAESVSAF